jgi:hypothetical protein
MMDVAGQKVQGCQLLLIITVLPTIEEVLKCRIAESDEIAFFLVQISYMRPKQGTSTLR